ncbi:hypothetical protein Syun_025982 [Stephania yunnanensis]|uniref:Uncharacterized protein n=1 Tax=Stephania yunnanensis TaxID=152371 RepID=A0AAP0HVB4_9MAGN
MNALNVVHLDGKNTYCSKRKKGVTKNFLCCFPIIPRLQRMFGDIDIAKELTWHASNKENDGKLTHPKDSPAWKSIDYKYSSFAIDPRNIRLGLATDDFNPFQDLSSRHSC